MIGMGSPKSGKDKSFSWDYFSKRLRSLIFFLLETLGKCLDEISQKFLQRKREENPALRFSDFWSLLQKEFSGDSTLQQRKAWNNVKLDTAPPLTGEKWRKFQVEFELRKGRVGDATDLEEYDLIYNQLPEYLQLRVSKEEAKKKKGQFWVKLTNLTNITPFEVQTEFSELFGWEDFQGWGNSQAVFCGMRVRTH